MILRNFYLVIIVFVISSCMTNVAFADDKIQVVTESWYPYNYLDKDGNVVGKSTLAVKEILAAAGIDYSIDVYPWARAFNLAKTRTHVLIYSILRTPDREKFFYWFCPISNLESHQIYKLTSRDDIIVNVEQDIKKYTISATRDTFLHQYMLGLGLVDGVNLQINSEDTRATKMFFAGRVDLIADLESSMERTLTRKGLDKSIVTPLTLIPAERYPANCMALSKRSPINLVNKIAKAHQKFISEL
jgi:polar amino acid transport system substrate-binding protein